MKILTIEKDYMDIQNVKIRKVNKSLNKKSN